MPYRSIKALPAQFKGYSQHGQRAAFHAFNNAYKEYSGNEHLAFATAHHAAQQADALNPITSRGPRVAPVRPREPFAE